MHVRALAPTILPLSTVCIRSRHARRRCAFDQRSVGHLRERSVVSLITPKVLKEARCQCVRLLIAPTILPLSTDCIRSRHARRRCAFDQRSVGHLRERSVITPKVLKEARRCELVLRDSFPFRWSASEVQAKWPVSAHTHRHSCWTDSKSFENPQLVWTGMWNLQRRSNGERQTNRARMKTATHGPDEGRLDLQKSVLIRGAKSFASPPQPSRTMATPKVLRVRHSPPARWRCEMGTIVPISQQEQI